MSLFYESHDSDYGKDALTFALGALGGLALGVVLSRRGAPERARELSTGLRERARAVGSRLRPARLRRMAPEAAELTRLEDAVLDAFLGHEVLGERGVDIGAISDGIIELSGSVWTEDESDLAMRLANSIPGVRTVVNRLGIETEDRHIRDVRSRFEGGESMSERQWQGRHVGMGRRRQGSETEPDRTDDSQPQTEKAMREADLRQWQEEGLSAEKSRTQARPEVQDANRTRYSEDELDNQDPHDKHAERTLDSQPQELNTDARVGEGLKDATELDLEQADVPAKPHGDREG